MRKHDDDRRRSEVARARAAGALLVLGFVAGSATPTGATGSSQAAPPSDDAVREVAPGDLLRGGPGPAAGAAGNGALGNGALGKGAQPGGAPIGGPPQAGASGEGTPADDGVPASYAGRYADGLREVIALARNAEHEAALELAERLLAPNDFMRWRTRVESWTGGLSEPVFGALDAELAWFGLETIDSAQRGEVHYAKGLIQFASGGLDDALSSLELARAEAGPGRTRLDSIYSLGTIRLMAGEAARLMIPEIAEKLGRQPTPPPAMPDGSEPPDPLELARAAYLTAKEHFVERLRAEWRDADTRANLELCLRRLKELDDLERQREEEQQQNQDQQDQQQEDQQDQQENEQEQDSDSDEESEQEKESDSKEDDQKPEPGEEDPEQNPDDQQKEPEKKAEPKEVLLTEEEMKRILDQTREEYEQGEEVREQVRVQRRVPTKRDW